MEPATFVGGCSRPAVYPGCNFPIIVFSCIFRSLSPPLTVIVIESLPLRNSKKQHEQLITIHITSWHHGYINLIHVVVVRCGAVRVLSRDIPNDSPQQAPFTTSSPHTRLIQNLGSCRNSCRVTVIAKVTDSEILIEDRVERSKYIGIIHGA